MSSLADFVALSQTLLDPTRPNAILPEKVLREWFRPLHAEWDGFTLVGMLWEIYQINDSFEQVLNVYQKRWY
jgi:hypothetical protein